MTILDSDKSKQYVTYSGQKYWLPPMNAELETLLQVDKQWAQTAKAQKLAEKLTDIVLRLSNYIEQIEGSPGSYNGTLTIKGSIFKYLLRRANPDQISDESTVDNYRQISLVNNDLQIAYIKSAEQSHSVTIKLDEKVVFSAHVMPPESLLNLIIPDSNKGTRINTIIPGMWIDQALDLGQILNNYISAQSSIHPDEQQIRNKVESARDLAYPDADLDMR